jgi:uncharacterized protein (DUF305 family)
MGQLHYDTVSGNFSKTQKSIVGVILFLLTAGLVSGQSMSAHMHSAQKNVFLAMMDTMMVRMDNVPKDEPVDVSFLQQMIPHHEGAMAMATYEIRHGRDFGMIQLAKSILAEQTHEVKQMNLWLSQRSADSGKAPVGFQQDMAQSMNRMMQRMPGPDKLHDTDRAFASVMKPHHQAAVDMAKALLSFTTNPQLRSYASRLITEQQLEIDQMTHYLN